MLQLYYFLAAGVPLVFGQAPIGGQANQGIVAQGEGTEGVPVSQPTSTASTTYRKGPETWFYSDEICDGDYSTSVFLEDSVRDQCKEITERISLWVNPDDTDEPAIDGCLYTFDSMQACLDGDKAGQRHQLDLGKDRDKAVCLQFDKPGETHPAYKMSNIRCDKEYAEGKIIKRTVKD